jgi:hypothetical protein
MQSSNDSLRFAGDVRLSEVQLNSLNGQVANVINQVELIEIYEDLFSSFTTISVVLRESVDYINLFPFIGEEFLDINIVTPTMDKPIKGRFYIYKITDRLYTKEREVMYTIKAISEEFLTDINTKISKAFGGNVSEIASSLLGKDGINTRKNVNIEKTSNKTKFTSNFWTPTKCLNYAASTAVNLRGNPSYLFYENRDGLNFRSIDELLKQQVYHKFSKDNYTRTLRDDESTNSVKDPKEDYRKILEMEIPVVTDYLKDIQGGQLKSRIISHDMVTKKYTVKDYSIKKDTNPSTFINGTPTYSKYATANNASTMIFMPKHYGSFNNFSDVTNHKTTQKRISFFQNIERYKVLINVFGRTDYTPGQIIELFVPKATQIVGTDTDPRDLVLSGKYLISAISHSINRTNHTCNIELIKNSILTDLTKY